jgi:anti-sigma regulatory factor (Ser/Thr protein kinase)
VTLPFTSDEWVTLTVPGDVRLLGVVRHAVEAVAELAGLSQKEVYDVVLAVNEACANVIQHGYGGRPGQCLTLACRPTPRGLELRLRDRGQPFEFEAAPDLPPDELREGGRGVFLIRKLMDEVSSSTAPETGNELRMFKMRK